MKHYNPSISEDAARILNLKGESTDEVDDIITPVIAITPRLTIAKLARAINATSATIYTTPTDKDVYVTNIVLSVIKDATATSAYSAISLTINGAADNVLLLPSLTLTAQNQTVSVNLPFPLKVDRGTNINVVNSTNVGNVTSTGIIFGFVQETLKGV